MSEWMSGRECWGCMQIHCAQCMCTQKANIPNEKPHQNCDVGHNFNEVAKSICFDGIVAAVSDQHSMPPVPFESSWKSRSRTCIRWLPVFTMLSGENESQWNYTIRKKLPHRTDYSSF